MDIDKLIDYSSRYSGEGKLQRLILIEKECPDLASKCRELIEIELFEQAAQTGITNTNLYKTCCENSGKSIDRAWISQIETKSNAKLEKLQNDLAIAHQNLHRNNVRVSQIKKKHKLINTIQF